MARVSGGNHHSLFLSTKGVVYSCGRADYGQLGYPVGEMDGKGDFASTPNPVPLPISKNPIEVGRVVDIAAGENHSLAITSTGKVYSWGYGEYGQSGNDPKVSDKDILRPFLAHDWLPGADLVATNISGGAQHTLVVAKRYKAKP
jgi:alpha-tubulin suppressor-like RCC1 family protein